VLPCRVEGASARLGPDIAAPLARPYGPLSGATELGIRPEFVAIGESGDMPIEIRAVEHAGRYKIVRGRIAGRDVNALLNEAAALPPEPRASFDPRRINIYADARLVEPEAA